MKYIIAICSVILAFACFTFQKNAPVESGKASVVHWCDGHQLEWRDFRGTPDLPGSHQALTAYEIRFDVSLNAGKLKFIVECNFVKNKSWVKKKSLNNAYLLRHEQLHFDLAEIYARKMRKQLAEENITVHNLQEKADQIYETNWKALVKIQRMYDMETDHSINTAAQEKWDKKITKMLQENLDYTDTSMCQ